MLSYSSETGWVYDSFQCIVFVLFLLFIAYRNRVRRKTLHQRDDGTYVWIEWHGGERCSDTDPTASGGAWDSDGGGDGGD